VTDACFVVNASPIIFLAACTADSPLQELRLPQPRSERHEEDLLVNILGLTGQQQELQIGDDLTDGAVRSRDDDSRHRHSRAHTLPGMPDQALLVVREKDPLLARREFEENRIVRPGQPSILGPHDIEIGDLTLESAEDAAVEVLIGQHSEHGR
jgi:hypothetical protein